LSPVLRGSAKAAIADRIRHVRTVNNLTQDGFAQLIGVSRSHLSAVETYRIEPSLECILGVLVLDLRLPVSGQMPRPVDPTWLLLGPIAEPDMWGKMRRAELTGSPRLREHFAWLFQTMAPPDPPPAEIGDAYPTE
jgi:DNA-binding XRE family transcriptional regulator